MFGIAGSAKAYTIENYQENVEDRFVISPVNLELTLAPGESSSQRMVVVNRLGRTADFKIDKEDFVGSQDPEKATVFLGGDYAAATSARDWITPEINEVNLNHGDRLSLPFEVKVPEGARTGSHYAAIFVSVSSDNSSGGKDKVRLVSRVGLLVLINVAGNNVESGEITEFKAGKIFYRNGPVDFSTVFRNTGNVYQRVKGEVAIKNIFGAEVAHLPIKEWVVLSDSSRRQETEWAKKWLVGRYTADLTVFYGFGGNLKDQESLVFYAFPWHVAILVILIFIIIYYLFKYFFSKFEIKKKE
ncbi:MAG: hypothetical protein WC831_05460 [Parcubacteria group bacterium]